jgi:catechol 2,3-dioxygenase-like lactoylglutathione lyase family enzyme
VPTAEPWRAVRERPERKGTSQWWLEHSTVTGEKTESQNEAGVIRDIVHLNLNVSDVKRSLEFYQKLGFQVLHIFGNGPQGSGDEIDDGMEFQGGRCRGAVITLGDHPRCWTKLELIEWVDPKPEPRKPAAAHALGISRIALRCKNLGALVERLEADGIVIETPPQQIDIVGAKGFALFRDPDGVLLELIEL